MYIRKPYKKAPEICNLVLPILFFLRELSICLFMAHIKYPGGFPTDETKTTICIDTCGNGPVFSAVAMAFSPVELIYKCARKIILRVTIKQYVYKSIVPWY